MYQVTPEAKAEIDRMLIEAARARQAAEAAIRVARLMIQAPDDYEYNIPGGVFTPPVADRANHRESLLQES